MLLDAPEAFTESYEEASVRPNEYWVEQLSGERVFFGGYADSGIVGSVNFAREKGLKSEHRGWLLGMYVAPHMRGSGLAQALIEALFEHARNHVIQVHLGVSAGNTAAIRLYERMGFVRTGTEPRYLKVNGTYIDEHMMVKFLD